MPNDLGTLTNEEYLKRGYYGGQAPITVESLSPEVPLELPKDQTQPDYLATLNSIPPIEQLISSEPTQTERNQDDLSSMFLKLTEEMGGQPVAQIKAEETAGLPNFQKQLTDINSQIQQLQKEAQAQNLQAEKLISGGQNLTAGSGDFLNKQQQEINRQASIKGLGLSAIAQTLQGNVATAQAQANRAVELEFAPKEAKLEFLAKFLEINEGKLNREDKKKFEQQQILLQERSRILGEQKENKQIVYGWVAEAAKNGAPTTLINQAISSGDPNYALSILGQYFQDPFAKEAALADLEYKRTQIKVAESGIESDKQRLELDKLKTQADIASTKSQTSLAWAKFQADQKAGASIKTEVIDNGRGGKMLINSQTGETIKDYGIDPVTGKATNPGGELKDNALISAKELLSKVTSGTGTSALGASRVFGFQLIPGTEPKNFEVQFDNVKSLLSLDNVKFLKGQGQVSDAERRLLADASAKLSLSQSEAEFKKSLENVIKALSGITEDTYTVGDTTYVKGSDGLYYAK